MIWLLADPLNVSKLSLFLGLPVCRGSRVEVGGAKSYDHEQAWPFINHSILSDGDPSTQYSENVVISVNMGCEIARKICAITD